MINIFETESYYKIFDDLPELPTELLEHNDFAMAKNFKHGTQFPMSKDYIRDDGRLEAAERVSTKLSTGILQWIHQNILPVFNDSVEKRRLMIYRRTLANEYRNFYPPHVDIGREFTLIYNVVDSGGDIIFWQQKGFPVFRDRSEGDAIRDYTSLTELCRFKSPYKKWYLLNNQVVHSVEDLKSERENIQIACFLTDPLVIDALNPIHLDKSTKKII
jgi:hypothetical protein